MTSELNSVVGIISSMVSLLGLWVLLFWFYRDYRVDAFRQEMFTLRDEMFDWAYKSKISFDHSGYGMLRSAMNGFIRFGHRLTLFQAILLYMLGNGGLYDDKVKKFSERWDEAMNGLDDDVRAQLVNYRERMHLIILNHLIVSPVVLVSVLFPLLVFALLRYCFSSLMNWLRQPFDRIDAAGYAAGQ